MELGGAETSLLGLLEALEGENISVDLWVSDPRGPLMAYLPDWVNVIESPKPYQVLERPILTAIKRGGGKVAIARLMAKIEFWRYSRHNKCRDGSGIFPFVDKWAPRVLPDRYSLGTYDIAISYCGFPRMVLDKVDAKLKCAWIHTDYSAIDVCKELERRVWERYDTIVCVSALARENFLKVFPQLEDKTVVIENWLPLRYISTLSACQIGEVVDVANGRIKFLTIGRYCAAKRLEVIPEICHRLIEMGIDLEWWIIGYGASDQYIRDSIEANGMEARVKLLGKKENPYPYIKACDWYVQPSLYEGRSVTVQEAQALGCPVIITDFPTAKSQLSDGHEGWIVPMAPRQCVEAIAQILAQYRSHKAMSNDSRQC
ncbi:MAG: glycosyltransferase [Bacteroidales bacterium]|nr:glycosyltransferase [Bacteroidales bacterium]